MVVLKKIRASTLMETLVATVLLVVIFMIASMILNNLFSNTIKGNTREMDTYLNELEYLYINNKLALPYTTDYKLWSITVNSHLEQNKPMIVFEAVDQKTKQTLKKERIAI
ncbi:hypothetical protein [Snuella lapsa]|uniref:Type II secretion system protein n=1 Tax=Snuella lapsa TaxID=870481 RepID=A0ABP6WMW8_9FLAO